MREYQSTQRVSAVRLSPDSGNLDEICQEILESTGDEVEVSTIPGGCINVPGGVSLYPGNWLVLWPDGTYTVLDDRSFNRQYTAAAESGDITGVEVRSGVLIFETGATECQSK